MHDLVQPTGIAATTENLIAQMSVTLARRFHRKPRFHETEDCPCIERIGGVDPHTINTKHQSGKIDRLPNMRVAAEKLRGTSA